MAGKDYIPIILTVTVMVGWLSSNAMEHIHGTPGLWESEPLVR